MNLAKWGSGTYVPATYSDYGHVAEKVKTRPEPFLIAFFGEKGTNWAEGRVLGSNIGDYRSEISFFVPLRIGEESPYRSKNIHPQAKPGPCKPTPPEGTHCPKAGTHRYGKFRKMGQKRWRSRSRCAGSPSVNQSIHLCFDFTCLAPPGATHQWVMGEARASAWIRWIY